MNSVCDVNCKRIIIRLILKNVRKYTTESILLLQLHEIKSIIFLKLARNQIAICLLYNEKGNVFDFELGKYGVQ